jgi:hypothetical protein
MVVLILASIVTANLSGAVIRSRRSVLAETLRELQVGCDLFCATSGSLPAGALYLDSTYGQEAFLLDFSARDHLNREFVPSYVRSRPDRRATTYGFEAPAGDEVFFGVTPGGKVFATRAKPDQAGGWSQVVGAVYTPLHTDGSIDYSVIAGPEKRSRPAAPSVATLTIQASSNQVPVASSVEVVAEARSAGNAAVAGAAVLFEIRGSVSGVRRQQVTTGSDGRANITVSTGIAELIVVTATVDQGNQAP